MRRARLLSLVPVLLVAFASARAEPVHHRIKVSLDPDRHHIEVAVTVDVPEALRAPTVRFVLHGGLAPTLDGDGLSLREVEGEPSPELLGSAIAFPDDVPIEIHEVVSDDGSPIASFTVRYAGAIHHAVREVEEDYARAFGETPGTIEDGGVFLGSSTYWLPWTGDGFVTFAMDIDVPSGWEAVSEGRRTVVPSDDGRVRVRFEESNPVEEVHLVAGRWTVYEDHAGRIATYVYLREPDAGLARTFLDTGAQYLAMYEGLIGAYPFDKFAVVENFWETGYGMPSFTLLGPRVIRFPFILHSSFPHEILHDWWGNGAYVDRESGNWCEGLTAYLADHLIKEQRGQGAEYRRDLLQKYADYVRDGLDFPLTEFRARHSSATQAVGYGKTAMLFHMLRHNIGDDAFVEGLRAFWKDRRFTVASWDDLRASFETASGADLGGFFATWTERTGAPALRLDKAQAFPGDGGKFSVWVAVSQTQEGAPYPIEVPIYVTFASGEVVRMDRTMNGSTMSFTERLAERPVHIAVDPSFDLFRRLDRAEIPPSFGRAFGAERVTVVVPSGGGPLDDAYAELAGGWEKTGAGEVEVVRDADLEALPTDRAVWVFGADNRFVDAVAAAAAPFGGTLDRDGWTVEGSTFASDGASIAIAVPHPANPDLAIAYLAADRVDALPGLGRKLPHYGKYGWLAFEGEAPDNVGKGQWDAVGSPLARAFIPDGRPGPVPAGAALATLPPLFSAERMGADVAVLTDPALEGRGCGTDGLARAADLIEQAFRDAGLAPGWGDGYRQSFEGRCEHGAATLENIVGLIPGTAPALAGKPLVVVAHYDHLGLGWPDAREGEAGKIHPGADDNASGVAVLIELARIFAPSMSPKRPVLFVATAGEESGLQGARAFATATAPWSPVDAIAALNLDTVGRLADGKLFVLGSGSADEWIHVVRGAGWVTGVAAEAVRDDLGGSDQVAFLDAGVPAVQFFTGPHGDYHRPSDTAETLDLGGMVDVATFVREFVGYLADREDPLTSGLEGAAPKTPAAARPGGRRVSLGTVPDFAWQEGGYRLGGVTPGSPAEAAGLREGDVIVRIDTTAIADLRDLSEALKGKEPGDRVTVTYVRDGQQLEATVGLVAR